MINYQLLADSQKFYTAQGFQVIETPWTVTKEISDITRPKDCPDWTIKEKGKVLVASAEQGFLYLLNKGFLPAGKYQSIGPCFRNDHFTTTHTKYFMKNELIVVGENRKDKAFELAQLAKSYFHKIGLVKSDIKETAEGYDVIDRPHSGRSTELGSYGVREHRDMIWLYGTALAEPRTSRLLNELP